MSPPPQIVVVHRGVPDPNAADPRARHAFHRTVLLASLTSVRVVALERQPDADPGALAAAGIPLAVGDGAVSALAGEACWATDLASALAVWRRDPGARFVVELDTTPSAEVAASALRPDGRNIDGVDHVLTLRHELERSVLGAAGAVATTGAGLRDHLAALGIAARVVAPCLPIAPEHRRGDQRLGVVHVGRWVSEEGHPDEDGLTDLVARLGADHPVTTVLALDAPPRMRALLVDRLDVVEPSAAAGLLRTTRAAVVPRRFGIAVPLTIATLVADRLPFLASAGAVAGLDLGPAGELVTVADPSAWAERLDALLSEPRRWRLTAEALDAVAAGWLDRERMLADTAELLTAAGLDVTAPSPVPPPSPTEAPAWSPPHRARVELPAGTPRSLPDVRAFERRLLGPELYTRMESVGTQGHLERDDGYRLWLAAHDDGPARIEVLSRRAEAFRHRPTISIVMPTYNSDVALLDEAVESVRAQTWADWQLCLADDGSPHPPPLERYAAMDERIVVTRLAENAGIAAATNAALALATGDYVGFLDHDDVLHPTALHWIVELLQDHPELDVVYTDEDRLDPDGRRAWPSFKPDWSPELLLAVNYVSHFTVMRRSLVEDLGGLRSGYDGSQDYDLLLRVSERTPRVGHVAKPLYSWRQTEQSTSSRSEAKPEADDAGRRALADALDRRGLDASVHPGYVPTWHEVRYRVASQPLVSAIIPTRDRVDLLRTCVDRLRASTDGHRVEIVVVDNDSRDPDTLGYLDELAAQPDAVVVRYPERFNYARQMNLGAAAASGDLLLWLNNDARPRTCDWLGVLIGHALLPEVGAVGARLVFPEGPVQHEGIACNVGGAVAWNVRATGLPTLARNTRTTTAVTGACLLTRRGVFEGVAGLDEQLRVAFNDVDFCRRVGELGYRVVYTPWCELEHAESASRGLLHPDDDEAFYVARWGGPDGPRDPYYSSSLDMAEPVSRFRI